MIDQTMSFEEALEKLEQNLNCLENDKPDLNEIVRLCQESASLAAYCKNLLTANRSKLAVLREKNGAIVEEEFSDAGEQ